jgi:hypothetical protein
MRPWAGKRMARSIGAFGLGLEEEIV